MPHTNQPPANPNQHPPPFGSGYPSQAGFQPQLGYPLQSGYQIQSHPGYPYLGQSPYPVPTYFGSEIPPYQSAPNPLHSGAAPYPATQGSYSTATSTIPSAGYPSHQPQYNHHPLYSSPQLTLPGRDLYPNLFGSGVTAAGTKSKVGSLIDIAHTLGF